MRVSFSDGILTIENGKDVDHPSNEWLSEKIKELLEEHRTLHTLHLINPTFTNYLGREPDNFFRSAGFILRLAYLTSASAHRLQVPAFSCLKLGSIRLSKAEISTLFNSDEYQVDLLLELDLSDVALIISSPGDVRFKYSRLTTLTLPKTIEVDETLAQELASLPYLERLSVTLASPKALLALTESKSLCHVQVFEPSSSDEMTLPEDHEALKPYFEMLNRNRTTRKKIEEELFAAIEADDVPTLQALLADSPIRPFALDTDKKPKFLLHALKHEARTILQFLVSKDCSDNIQFNAYIPNNIVDLGKPLPPMPNHSQCFLMKMSGSYLSPGLPDADADPDKNSLLMFSYSKDSAIQVKPHSKTDNTNYKVTMDAFRTLSATLSSYKIEAVTFNFWGITYHRAPRYPVAEYTQEGTLLPPECIEYIDKENKERIYQLKPLLDLLAIAKFLRHITFGKCGFTETQRAYILTTLEQHQLAKQLESVTFVESPESSVTHVLPGAKNPVKPSAAALTSWAALLGSTASGGDAAAASAAASSAAEAEPPQHRM